MKYYMKNVYILLAAALLTSCFGNSESKQKSDDRITVGVTVDTKADDPKKDDDSITVDVGVDTKDSASQDADSIDVDITIDSKPLEDPEPAPNPDPKPDGEENDLEENQRGIFIFVEEYGSDIKLSMSAREGVETIEICMAEKSDCLANKSGLDRLSYGKNGSKNGRVMFENYKAPAIGQDWTIYAKDQDGKFMFYRSVIISGVQ